MTIAPDNHDKDSAAHDLPSAEEAAVIEPSAGVATEPPMPSAGVVQPPAPDAGPSESEDPSAVKDPQAGHPEVPAAPTMGPAACAAELAQRFPALFAAEGGPRPLKLRIQADIQQRAPGVFTRKALSLFLHRHTTSTAYLKSLVALAQRFDLDGAPAGEAAPEHLQAAREELDRRRAIVAARRPPREAGGRPDGDGRPAPTRGRDQADAPERPRARDHVSRPPQRPRFERGARPSRPLTPRPDTDRSPLPPPRQDSPADPARRDRAALLRLWESTALTKANFCALKRISEAELDAALALARHERTDVAGRG